MAASPDDAASGAALSGGSRSVSLDVAERRIAQLVGLAGVGLQNMGVELREELRADLRGAMATDVEEAMVAFSQRLDHVLAQAGAQLDSVLEQFESLIAERRGRLLQALEGLEEAHAEMQSSLQQSQLCVEQAVQDALEGWEGPEGFQLSANGVINLRNGEKDRHP